jgi:hypothetical protein
MFRTYISLSQDGYKLYYMVAQLRINKEMWILHNCFHCFVHPNLEGMKFKITKLKYVKRDELEWMITLK